MQSDALNDMGKSCLRFKRIEEPVASYSCFLKLSPISQNIGGQSPTKRARRSAFPRSS